MKIITEETVRSLATAKEALSCVRAAHQDLARGIAVNVPRSRARSGKFTLHSLPAASTALDRAAIKVYSSVGKMADCHVLLYQVSTGALLGAIEAVELGRLRTAGAAVLAAAQFTQSKLGSVAIIGSGYQGQGVAHYLLTLHQELGVSDVSIYSRDESKASIRASELNQTHAFSQVKVRGLSLTDRSGIANATTIFTATTSTDPVLKSSEMHGIRHISALGSNSLIRRELDAQTILGARGVYVDAIDVAQIEGGTLLPLFETGRLNWNQVGTLGDALSGTNAPQINAGSSYTVFCSHGLGVQDLYLASHIWDRAQSKSTQDK